MSGSFSRAELEASLESLCGILQTTAPKTMVKKANSYHCELCNVTTPSEDVHMMHLGGKKHLGRLRSTVKTLRDRLEPPQAPSQPMVIDLTRNSKRKPSSSAKTRNRSRSTQSRAAAMANPQAFSRSAPPFVPRHEARGSYRAHPVYTPPLQPQMYLIGPRYQAPPPWLSTTTTSLVPLSKEIALFSGWISPTPAERKMRKAVVGKVTSLVRTLWPNAMVKVFGSCATNLYLPASDIDLVVEGAWGKSPLFVLSSTLQRSKISRSVNCLANARIPVIKLVEAESGCLVDITLNLPTGPSCASLVKEYLEAYPLVRPLLLLIKYYLSQLGLNEPYTGGVGSYTLFIMLVSFFQMQQRDSFGGSNLSSAGNESTADSASGVTTRADADLGTALLQFLELYGLKFNYTVTGISIRDGGSYFPKARRGWTNTNQPWLLACEDPTNPESDVSRTSFGIVDVRHAFANAFQALSSPSTPEGTFSQLSCVLLRDRKIQTRRKFVETYYSSRSSDDDDDNDNDNDGDANGSSSSSSDSKTVQTVVAALPQPHQMN